MSYKIAVRNNETKEVRIYDMGVDWCKESSLFYLQEGNFSCDCNRELAFLRAGEEPEPKENICGETKYSIPYALVGNRKIKVEG